MWCSAADTHLKLLDHIVSGASFSTGGVFECDLEHRRSVSVLCVLYKSRCNQMHPLYGALPVLYVPVRVTGGAMAHICTLMRLLAVEPHSFAGLLFPCQYLCGPILVTQYSMIFDWRVSRAGPMPFYWPSCSLPYCRLLFYISLLSCYLFLLWGYCLWTDRVLIALSQPCITNLFYININNNDTKTKHHLRPNFLMQLSWIVNKRVHILDSLSRNILIPIRDPVSVLNLYLTDCCVSVAGSIMPKCPRHINTHTCCRKIIL